MFTGLVEKTVEITSFKENSNGATIEIPNIFQNEVKLGDSIAINGICLTVKNLSDAFLTFEISNETLRLVDVKALQTGKIVNLERALKLSDRLGGHMVSGHIDGVAKISDIKNDGFSYIFKFETNENIAKYIVKKGSITINGISLTIATTDKNIFSVEIIPYTYKNTNLIFLKKGDIVNIETDIISRYVEKFLFLDKNSSKINMEMLKENGYY